MERKYLAFGILIGFVIALVIVFSFNSSITGNVISEGLFNELICEDKQVPYDYLEEYSETVPYTDTECEDKLLTYSITDFSVNSDCLDSDERCLDYFLGICIEKETFCVQKSVNFGLDLNNFDDGRGTWIIKFVLYGDGSEMDYKSQTVSLYPLDSTELYWTFSILGEDNCKKKVTGNYLVETEPTKQICRDVTKYQEVTKTRTVTRYRTEKVCE